MKIAYNAGHCLSTAGKRLPAELDPSQTREWVLNDRVARYFAEEMAQYEDVELRRFDDPTGKTAIDIDGADGRVARANAWGADFYLSIHHNAAGKVFDGGGVVAYIYLTGGKAEIFAKAIYDAVIQATGLKGNRADPIQTSKQRNLYEPRATKMPAVLMEYGFMDSRVDAPIILTEEFSKKAGVATAQAVAKAAGLKRKSQQPAFSDVEADAWYADEVNYAKEQGLMEGTGNGKFQPGKTVTRAELATVLARLDQQLKGN